MSDRKPKSPRTRVLLDLSHTHFHNYRTGIQRVVRSLHQELPEVARELNVDFAAVVLNDGQFVFLDSLQQNNSVAEAPKPLNLLEYCPVWYKVLARTLCAAIPARFLRRWLLPEPGHKGIFRNLKWLAKVPKAVPSGESKAVGPTPVEFRPNDVLLMPDGYWVMMHIWDAVAKAKQQGVKVAVVVYDLICITHPQFFGPGASECFTKYLAALNAHVDVAMAISRTVQGQLRTKLAEIANITETPPKCSSFRLGVTIENPEGQVREHIKALFAQGESPYLMVSTFEPRKNHQYVMDSFDQCWEQYPERRLLFVGAVGWMSESMLNRIQTHPQFGTRLLMVNDASDAEVQYCYEQCRAVIYPSHVEGFGLPIIEGLRNGKATFASDTAIHREVGREYCAYFDLDQSTSLVDAIKDWERAGCPNTTPDQDQLLVSWRQSSKQLLGSVLSELDKASDGMRSKVDRRAA